MAETSDDKRKERESSGDSPLKKRMQSDEKDRGARIATREEWLKEREELLIAEKKLSQTRKEVAKKRRELPLVEIEDYVFGDVKTGKEVSLSELFKSSNNNRLLIQHVMFEEKDQFPCPRCSCWVDVLQGASVHFGPRCGYVIVCKASVSKTRPIVEKKGWNVRVLSSEKNTFNHDFGVEFTKEELASGSCYNYGRGHAQISQAPGLSFFVKGEDGKIYHNYSTYSAGLAEFNPMFAVLDCLPEGRNEEEKGQMWWVKHSHNY